ncbi:MFS transporter [Brachybacterium sp. EF45031]|nr:MFS transporter [Brachybacterium sillae]MCS6711608.1 MFS transporter [Brachybacterium sillae]
MLAVLLVPLFMALVAISVINVALTAIGTSLEADSSALQWVISGYALAFGLLLVPSGRLGDATGRKRIFLAGVAVFTAGSLLSGLALTVEVLNVARLLQGIGSGLLNPQAMGLIQAHFTGQARARAFASFGTTVAVATAVGPLLGGVLIQVFGEDLGWRAMFLLNVPLGIASVLAGLRWIPGDARRESLPQLDPVGIVLLGVAILGIMAPFLERDVNPLVWLSLPAGLLVLGAWWLWEHREKDRGREPMVDPALFANEGFRNGLIIIAVFFLGSTSIWIVVPLYLQMHLDHTAFQVALLGLPSSILAAISSQVGGRYVLRLGRKLVIAGFATAAAGLTGVALLAAPIESGALPYWVLTFPLALMGVSQGMTISPNQTLTLGAVDPRSGGVAGGILSLGQRLGAAVGTALIPGILFTLTEGGGSWLEGFVIAISCIVALTLAAMGVSVHDLRRERRERRAGAAARG